MGVTQGAGLSLKWFRDNFFKSEMETANLMGVDPYVLMDKEAETVPIGANRLLYLPYLMGERTPHLDPDARGVFFGLSAIHTKKDMLRAVMEGVGYSLRDCLSVFREMNITVDEMLACGGGGRSPLWRQILADLYDCPIKAITSQEGPALGVALLAGVGAGIYGSVSEACESVIKVDKIQPSIEQNTAIYEGYYRIYKNIYPALKQSFKELQTM
jgi:xylulokinase